MEACLKDMIDYRSSVMGQQMALCKWEWVKPVNQLQRQGKTCCLIVAHTVRSISQGEVLHYAAVSLLTSIRPSAALTARDSLINEKTTTEVSMLYL